jgi:hypothetical protein
VRAQTAVEALGQGSEILSCFAGARSVVARGRRRLRRCHADLGRLGARPRRQHDARRTFISLRLEDGARWDNLRWVTHSRPWASTIDDYTTLVWGAELRAIKAAKPAETGPALMWK